MALLDITIPVGYGTKLEPRAGKKVIKMDDNSYDILSLSSQETYTGKIILVFLIESVRDDVMTFYYDNKDLTWQFQNPLDGLTYDLEFTDPAPHPMMNREYQPPRWTINFNVIGTRQ